MISLPPADRKHIYALYVHCKFSLNYQNRIHLSCLVMRIKQMIIHNNSFEMKNQIPQIFLQGNSSGDFSNTSYGVLRTERVNKFFKGF